MLLTTLCSVNKILFDLQNNDISIRQCGIDKSLRYIQFIEMRYNSEMVL